MLRSRVILTIAGLIVASGCAKTTRPGDLSAVRPWSEQPRAGNVYLLRGVIGVFSEGIDQLAKRINQTGTRAMVYQDGQWSALARRITEQYRAVPDAEPLVLIGHSYGADDAIRIARELEKAGIMVDLLVTLDPVTPPPVPGNVLHCINIYQSNGAWDVMPFLRGVALNKDAGSRGRLQNLNIRADRTDLLERGTDHFNIEKKQKVHEEVIGNVLLTCPPRQVWLASRDREFAPRESRTDNSTALHSGKTDLPASAQQAGHRMGN